jgi:glycosyltransferase involved in cell wall biosynthesis
MSRILWIGCHKLLVNTELRALRDMGYEVYRPTYLSKIYDQSANLEVDENPSTLPEETLQILSATNFFYEKLSSKTEQLINEYFDICVVTISPNWLKNLAIGFKGKIIYRTYGQPYSLTTEFDTIGLTAELINRRNFYFLPHSLKSLESEHAWLIDKAVEVPYWIEDDVFELEDTWRPKNTNGQIGLLCPNIENSYYKSHYNFLNQNFKKKAFRVFGVQKSLNLDKWVVGTLPREALLGEFKSLSGFLYTYAEQNTCYLPPIEASVIGVPILYPKGSLLSKYIGAGGPGEWRSVKEANNMAQKLIEGDSEFVKKLLKSQKVLRDLYRKDSCLNAFKEVFKNIINEPASSEIISNQNVIIPFFFPGNLIIFDGKSYSTAEGIPRVIKFYVDTLLSEGFKVTILVHEFQMASTWGYFNQGRESFYADIVSVDSKSEVSKLFSSITTTLKPLSQKLSINLKQRIFAIWSQLQQKLRDDIKGEVRSEIEKPQNPSVILFPHYYHFNVLLDLDIKIPIILYLPDYIPFLYPKNFANEIRLHESQGTKIANRADLIITNSKSTEAYLPKTPLGIESSKIRVFPLPRLGDSRDSKEVPLLRGKKYLFYPTQFRPNKRIDLLLKAFDQIAKLFDVYLVLTGNLEDDQKSKKVYGNLKNKDRIHLLGVVTDSELNWLYQNATAVVVSSESEGNFPTQLTEAIHHATPFVAPRIDVVLEELGSTPGLYLFSGSSIQELRNVIKDLLENIKIERKRMVKLKNNYEIEHLLQGVNGIISVVREAFTVEDKGRK